MIQSMTGYGRAEYIYADHKTIVEIRSLNSKQLDMTLKISPFFRLREQEIRTQLASCLQRGKVDVTITTVPLDNPAVATASFAAINKDAFRYYYSQLRALQSELDAAEEPLFATILHMPDVMQAADTSMDDTEWSMLKGSVEQAIDAFNAFRIQEGRALQTMFADKLDGIEQLLNQVEPLEKERIDKIRQRLCSQLELLSEQTQQAIDRNRLEAELIYYLEKLDITEEKVRLRNHLRYFRETMETAESDGVGKKLGFVAQEMGREINTLGSKANHSEMQIIVVKMKDLLEQIKEQVLNVL